MPLQGGPQLTTWISHLRIADLLLEAVHGLDHEAFAIGSIAPDSGVPNEDWTAFEPPPSVTHFHPQGAGHQDIEDLRFYGEFLGRRRLSSLDDPTDSFIWGYFFHLVTDRLWMIRVAQPTWRKFARQFESEAAFLSEAKRDWYGLDFEYVRREPNSLYARVFLGAAFELDPLPFLPTEAIRRNILYIQQFYQRRDEEIDNTYIKRPNRYFLEFEMNDFVTLAAALLQQVFHALASGELVPEPGVASILEIEPYSRLATAQVDA